MLPSALLLGLAASTVSAIPATKKGMPGDYGAQCKHHFNPGFNETIGGCTWTIFCNREAAVDVNGQGPPYSTTNATSVKTCIQQCAKANGGMTGGPCAATQFTLATGECQLFSSITDTFIDNRNRLAELRSCP